MQAGSRQGSEVVTSICGACGHVVERPTHDEKFWLRFERDRVGDDVRVQTSPLPALPDLESLAFRRCARTGSYETKLSAPAKRTVAVLVTKVTAILAARSDGARTRARATLPHEVGTRRWSADFWLYFERTNDAVVLMTSWPAQTLDDAPSRRLRSLGFRWQAAARVGYRVTLSRARADLLTIVRSATTAAEVMFDPEGGRDF